MEYVLIMDGHGISTYMMSKISRWRCNKVEEMKTTYARYPQSIKHCQIRTGTLMGEQDRPFAFDSSRLEYSLLAGVSGERMSFIASRMALNALVPIL